LKSSSAKLDREQIKVEWQIEAFNKSGRRVIIITNNGNSKKANLKCRPSWEVWFYADGEQN